MNPLLGFRASRSRHGQQPDGPGAGRSLLAARAELLSALFEAVPVAAHSPGLLVIRCGACQGSVAVRSVLLAAGSDAIGPTAGTVLARFPRVAHGRFCPVRRLLEEWHCLLAGKEAPAAKRARFENDVYGARATVRARHLARARRRRNAE